MATSGWNRRPTAALAQLSCAVLAPLNVQPAGRGAVRVTVGSDVVRLRARDDERLLVAAGGAGSSAAGHGPDGAMLTGPGGPAAGGSAITDGTGGPAHEPG